MSENENFREEFLLASPLFGALAVGLGIGVGAARPGFRAVAFRSGRGALRGGGKLAQGAFRAGHVAGKFGVKRAPTAGRFLGRGAVQTGGLAARGTVAISRAPFIPAAVAIEGSVAVAQGVTQAGRGAFEGSTRVESAIGTFEAKFVNALTLGLLPDRFVDPKVASQKLTASRRQITG